VRGPTTSERGQSKAALVWNWNSLMNMGEAYSTYKKGVGSEILAISPPNLAAIYTGALSAAQDCQ
jgi:hypothetical protein